jgi:hypothetical protein
MVCVPSTEVRVDRYVSHSGQLELHWETDELGSVTYGLYERGDHGQLAFVDGMEQGPFDTSLEVAQWLLRTISRRVPPSRC